MQISLGYINPLNNYYFTPLALGYLKSIIKSELKDENINSEIFEFKQELSTFEITNSLLSNNPDIIGLSSYVWNFNKVKEVCEFIKGKNPRVKIILGGPQVSDIGKEILEENQNIDFIIEGEAEITYLELIKKLFFNENNFEEIKGIVFRKNNIIIQNNKREQINDIDNIPSPYLTKSLIPKNKGLNPIETSRGCVFKCKYCFYHKNFSNVRFFSFERLEKEFELLFKQNIEKVLLLDSTFNLSPKRAIKICQIISKYNKQNAIVFAEVKLELVNEELAMWLDKANIRTLYIGLQSTNPKALEHMNRKNDLEKIQKNIEILKKYNINTVVQIINGLPGDNLKTFKESLEFAKSLRPTDISIFHLQVLPGTDFYHEKDKYKLVFDKNYYLISNYSFSEKEILESKKIADEFMNNNFSGNKFTTRVR